MTWAGSNLVPTTQDEMNYLNEDHSDNLFSARELAEISVANKVTRKDAQ